VLECIPAELARIVTSQLRIPTIGIGAGPHVDGQVLVYTDLLGLDLTFTPRFAKHFAEVGAAVLDGVSAYVREVKARTFPADEHSFHSASVRLVPAPVEEDHAEPQGGVTGAPI
jgi:3-methyl-2-oxobutanoate hydroxymethyltransferase